MSCGTCHYFRLYEFSDPNDNEAIGECTWHENSLPFSMRYANRERMSVSANEGEDCVCYEGPFQEISNGSYPIPKE